MVRANSIQQYDKWKAWRRGEIKIVDMFSLASAYYNEICGLCFKLDKTKENMTDIEVFNMVADNILPPK